MPSAKLLSHHSINRVLLPKGRDSRNHPPLTIVIFCRKAMGKLAPFARLGLNQRLITQAYFFLMKMITSRSFITKYILDSGLTSIVRVKAQF